MKISQIYSELNTIKKAMTGTTDIAEINSSNFVSFGNDVLNAKDGVQNFGRALGDRIARILTEVQAYTRRDRMVYAEPLDYGSALKIIHFKDTSSVANTMWGDTTNSNPYALGTQLEYAQSIYSKNGVWSFNNLIIQRDQLKKAFLNENEMAAFLDSQFTIVYNNFELDIEACENTAIGTGMAECFTNKATKPKRAINLLKEYNALVTTPLTNNNCLNDKEFLRYASMRITTELKNMQAKTEIYNNLAGVSMKCENPIVEVLSDFATNSQFYLDSDTFHNELVTLKNYREVSHWMGMGNNATFNQKSEVHITNTDMSISADITGVICFIRDSKAIRTMVNEVYSDTMYNGADRTTHYYFNAERGYLIDLAYPMCVFYVNAEEV